MWCMYMSDVAFESLTPAEWFRRNKEIAGFSSPSRAMYQTVRELIENALDATENHGILPSIKASIRYVDKDKDLYSIYVEDNGIGIPEEEIPNVFGQIFYSSKYKIKQHRGIFGLGAKMVVLYAQSTSGMPVRVTSSMKGSQYIYTYEISIDTVKNKPVIHSHVRVENKYGWHGTAVKVVLEGNWQYAKSRIEEYFTRTAMITPYAEIILIEPNNEVLRFNRITTIMPKPPVEGLPHPSSIDLESLKQLISRNSDIPLIDFLKENFDGIGDETVREFMKTVGIRASKHVKRLSESELRLLAEKMRQFNGWRRPRADWLSPIGEKILANGILHVLKPEAVFVTTRKPSSYSGHPFIVEAAIAWGGSIMPVDKPILYRYANKVPLLQDEGSDVIRHVIDEVDWSQYKVKFPAPLAVVVHVCSTKIPYASAGKEAIADVPEIEKEVRLAVREVARKLKVYLARKEKEQELLTKYAILRLYTDEVSSALSFVSGVDENVIKGKLEELIKRKLGLDIRAGPPAITSEVGNVAVA
ncbi:DNA topoisomerase VI, B subunit [Caldivirga maquilingensis IC-167]|uniref:Type 2 DNA topoisomerase 6 subunit B n=2 Tax=Caldivirga maquilingensis TaxID=76887 RepID=A8ME40_CALMQ|nr:DNA topoisomerase VI, B subunit [Caldivirga maquilingensis IC-167]